jgi:hypothetical protein
VGTFIGTGARMRDWVPLMVAAFALAAAIANYRGTIRVSRANEEGNQLKWLQAAREEAHAAKEEADETREECAATKRDLAQTERKLVELGDLVEELTRWTLRVLAWKDDPGMSMEEIRRLINGGPPSMRRQIGRGGPEE